MEIHSSSLRFFTASENAKNKSLPSLSSPFKKDNKGTLAAFPQEKTSTNTEIYKTQSLRIDAKQQQNYSSNLRNSRALNLYTQENTQSLQNQSVGLISKIDFFI